MSDARPPILDYATPASGDDDFVPLHDYFSPVEANLAVALLDSEDIPAILAGENASITIGLAANLSRITLLVPRGQLARATELLRQQGNASADSDPSTSPELLVNLPQRARLPIGRVVLILLLTTILLVLIIAIAMMS